MRHLATDTATQRDLTHTHVLPDQSRRAMSHRYGVVRNVVETYRAGHDVRGEHSAGTCHVADS